ncbi:putative 1,4-benzoquinone reductase [Tilletiopsis washingtonensis]|uniref:Putative 1,4-benzoquinone reductase n=1 Tax=Tilletiopsis washingtonensis TaxID=58919 RepID=A0A316ZLL7_9BASI|nr:putative 1,4-benzoquinone reductase [Tilletiopsis washingtonensis]PWO01224.1 putative 1,4-benzoquinone reductase [Tilletiopsis washingtonensis]
MSKLLQRLSLSSKKSSSSSISTAPAAAPAAPVKMAKVALLVYSLYGHQVAMSKAVEAGLKEAGVESKTFQVRDILSEEVLGKMHANKSLTADLPVIDPDTLAEFDGFIVCAGTRYGRQPASVSAFFDQTGGLWARGALKNKMAGFVTSTGSQHGGAETTALTTIPFLAHHGIIFVPLGFTQPELSTLDEIVGASAYGAATITGGDGSRQPTEKDLKVAKVQGKEFGETVAQFIRGKSA